MNQRLSQESVVSSSPRKKLPIGIQTFADIREGGYYYVDKTPAIHRLVEAGNTVVTIEHNLEIIKEADYLVDLGPEGGNDGGYLVASGPPLEVVRNGKRSYTASYLRDYLNANPEGRSPVRVPRIS